MSRLRRGRYIFTEFIMERKLVLVVLIILIFSYVCYAGDFIEIGATVIWNPRIFHDTTIVGGVNLALSLSQPNHFGFGLFSNLAFIPYAAFSDFMAGPIFEININDKISLIPCVGLYLGMIFFGFGGNVTVQYALHPKISFFARVQYAYTIFLIPGVDSLKTSVVSSCIGIGYRLDNGN